MRALGLLCLSTLVACGAAEQKQAPQPAASCDLTFSKLDGKSFVWLKPMGANKFSYWPRARILFSGTGDAMTARFTADQLLDVYDYSCEVDAAKDQLVCTTAPYYDEICRAMEVAKQGSCTKENIAALGFKGADDKIDEQIKVALEDVAKFRKTSAWDRYATAHDNANNGVQGVLYISINKARCRLQIEDKQRVVWHGNVQESYRPIGDAAFAPARQELLFESCPNELLLADLNEAELPKDLSTLERFKMHDPDKDVHYFYLGTEAVKAEEGCTYAADIYADYAPVKKDVAVAPDAEGKLTWHFTHAWKNEDRRILAPGKNGGVLEVVRTKTCGGKETVIDTVCNYTIF